MEIMICSDVRRCGGISLAQIHLNRHRGQIARTCGLVTLGQSPNGSDGKHRAVTRRIALLTYQHIALCLDSPLLEAHLAQGVVYEACNDPPPIPSAHHAPPPGVEREDRYRKLENHI